jgi:hypothetical protein
MLHYQHRSCCIPPEIRKLGFSDLRKRGEGLLRVNHKKTELLLFCIIAFRQTKILDFPFISIIMNPFGKYEASKNHNDVI